MQELTSYNIDLVFDNGSRSTYVFHRPCLQSGPQVVRDVIDLLTHQQIVNLLTTTTKSGVSACFFCFKYFQHSQESDLNFCVFST